jgi:DNA-binding IclR family transcriptional regulator
MAAARRGAAVRRRPRPSPPTERVVRILRRLAGADAPMTLTRVARQLGLNLSTCQTILDALDAAGFVVRSASDKTYALGPALIHLGEAARALTPLLARARGILDDLHAEIGFGCTLLAPTHDELVVVHRTGRLEDYPVPALAQGPLPFAAPFGATIVASAPPERQAAWLARIAGSPAELARYRALLGTARENGWCAWSYSGATERLLPSFESLFESLARDTHSSAVAQQVFQLLALAESRVFLADEIARSSTLSVTMLTLPTQLPTTPLEIDVYLYQRELPRRRLERVAGATRRAAAAIAGLGRVPGATGARAGLPAPSRARRRRPSGAPSGR